MGDTAATAAPSPSIRPALSANPPAAVLKSQQIAALDKAMINRAVSRVTSRLQNLASADPAAFAKVLRQAFGDRMDADEECSLIERAIARQLPLPRRILFVPASALLVADAAYSSNDGGVILISDKFHSDSEDLQTLIHHEWGHHLDALLGPGDSPVDEGEVLALGVYGGGPISAALLNASPTNDHSIIIRFEGR